MSKLPKDPAASGTFCVLPWIHSHFGTDGRASLCCVAHGELAGPDGALNVQRHTLADIFHSPAMDDARRRLLAGEKIEACVACYDAERLGANSLRIGYNAQWQGQMPGLMDRIRERQEKAAFEKPVSADFRFGNVCNLRCQICNGHNSSQIERDTALSKWSDNRYQRITGRFAGDWYDAPELAAEVADFSSDVRLINIGGGEPSLSKALQEWFVRLIESGQAAKTELRVSTNLTNVNPRFIDLVVQFGQPGIFLSIDGFGPLNDYLRYPSKWRIVERNADYLVDLAKRSKLNVYLTPVISAYNALSIVHLFEWAASRGFDIIANQVQGVEQIDLAALPDEARALAVQRMRDFLKASKSPIPNRGTIEDLCRYIETPVDPAYAASCLAKFHAFTHEIDADRGLRFEDYSPEMAQFLGYRSGSNSAF